MILYIDHGNQKVKIDMNKGVDLSIPNAFNSKNPSFKIVGSHVDSPCFKLKSQALSKNSDYTCLNPQVHGGIIYRSWLDRPLGLSGVIHSIERSNKKMKTSPTGLPQIKTTLVKSEKPLAIIPDSAIHLDPQKKKNGSLNPETMLKLILGSKDEKNLCEQLKKIFASQETISSFDLYAFPTTSHQIAGTNDEFIVGARHDNIAMVFSSLTALVHSLKTPSTATKVAAFFDAEETGSLTSSGAKSNFLRDTLSYFYSCTKNKKEEISSVLAKSFFVSADMAHALHPSHESLHDENHRPIINQGIVIKENSNDKYITTGYSSSVVKAICESANIPLQDFVARQDTGCGSTVGPAVAANLGCLGADIGVSMWAMHSAAETMGTQDLWFAKKFFETFWS